VRVVALSVFVCAILTACGSSKTSAPAASSSSVSGTLHTLPALHPPKLTVSHRAGAVAPGYVFVAQKGGAKKPGGPVIVDDRGRIVWYHEVPKGLEATDFRVQTYQGKPVLTWWQGKIAVAGFGQGAYEIYDRSYHRIAELKAGNGLDGDLHEFQLTPRGTAYVSIYDEVPADLTSVGGPKSSWAEDSVVQELDVKTGKVVWQWRSLDHVPLTESVLAGKEPAHHAKKTRAFDYFHVNSVGDGPNGTVLVSGRNTSALYLIRRDGSIAWRLGGKKSDFGPPAAVKMFFQHDARFHGADTISLFDNGAIPRMEPYTRPEILKIDTAKKTARIVKTFLRPKRVSAPFEGNLELLADGGAFVGWGGVPKVTEFDASGKVQYELTLPYGDTYRGYRLPWDGDPGGKPAVSVSGSTVYASWNGKPGIARWRVLSGGKAVASARWAGLETSIGLPKTEQDVSVEALDADGNVLGTSS
jgi:Arylsulfotransferase (ASST)